MISLLAITSLSLAATGGTVGQQSGLRPAGGSPGSVQVEPAVPAEVPVVSIDLPKQEVVLPSGEVVDFGAHELWRPICSGTSAVSRDELMAMAQSHHAISQQPVRVIDNTQSMIGGFNVAFVLSGSIPPAAPAAFAACEAYIESFFSDPITITVNVSFQVLSPGVLGSTGSSYGYVSYTGARAQIVGDMDGSDTLQSFLPSGSTCPVRYQNNQTVTNEDRVFVTFANWKAMDGVISGADANMTLNSNFAFDYDPSNGIGANQYSIQDIVIHETGHAMGFTSGVDFRFRDIETLDLFRFQRTDGTNDANPDTTAEFQVRPRRCSFNFPNDDHNSDLISAEFRMSDGNPYQASHFREQTPNIGLMDPALAPQQTFYPAFYSTADVAMFDAIGYDN
jgi:hypothetical protein